MLLSLCKYEVGCFVLGFFFHITALLQLTLKASARISAPLWLVRLERPTKNSRPVQKKKKKNQKYQYICVKTNETDGKMYLRGAKEQNLNPVSLWSNSSWTLQSPQCVLYACLWERPTVVSMVGHKQTEAWMPGEAAAHWAQGWGPNVAAEPLQNEPLAGALPTGNVSSPAMWNRFQLEGTRAQSQCLETQLSVLCFFLVACAV